MMSRFLTIFAKKGTVLIACLLAILQVSCEKNESVEIEIQEKSDSVLTRAIYSAHLPLDPHQVKVIADSALVRDLFVGLMAFDRAGNVIPGVAKSSFSDDGKNWLFILDENATWSNGDSVTADDFVASWQRLMDRISPSPWAHYLVEMKIENAKEILAQEVPLFELGVKALNDHTLQISLEEPNFQLPLMLTHISLLPSYKGREPRKELVSNGAYQLSRLGKLQAVLSARNEDTPFKQVVYQLITTVQNPARFDIVENPLPNYQYNQQLLPRLCTYFYEFNFNDPLVGQKGVRKAIKSMIFTPEVSQRLGIPIHTALPRTLWSEDERRPINISAEHILSKSGIDYTNLLNLSLAFGEHQLHNIAADRIARLLSQSDLFRIRLQQTDNEVLMQKRERQDFQLIQREFCAAYPDLVVFLKMFHSESPENKTGYGNEKVDLWLEELSVQPLSTEERYLHIQKIVQQINEDIVILPLFQYQRRIAVDPSIVGIHQDNASDVIYSKDLSRQSIIKDK